MALYAVWGQTKAVIGKLLMTRTRFNKYSSKHFGCRDAMRLP